MDDTTATAAVYNGRLGWLDSLNSVATNLECSGMFVGDHDVLNSLHTVYFPFMVYLEGLW